MTRTLSLASLFLCLCASLGFGQEAPNSPEPEIKVKLDSYRGPPGSVVTIRGIGFGTDQESVTALLGGKPAFVSQVLDDSIIVISDLKTPLGKQQLLISIGETKLSLIEYQVLDPKNLPADYLKENTKVFEANKRAEEESKRRKLLAFSGSKLIVSEDTTKLQLFGTSSQLLSGTEFYVELSYEGRPILLRSTSLSNERWSVDFDLAGKSLFPGRYTLRMHFLLRRQKRAIIAAYRKAFSSKEYNKFSAVFADDFVDIGSPEVWKTERFKIIGELRSGIAIIHSEVDDFADLYASTARIAFQKGKKIDVDAWKTWLANSNLSSSDKDFERIDLRRECLKGKHFDPVNWDKYVVRLIGKLTEQIQRLKRLGLKYRIVPFGRLHNDVLLVMAGFLNSVRFRTDYFYGRYKTLNLSDKMRTQFDSFPVVSSQNMSFDLIRRFCKKTSRKLAEESRMSPPESFSTTKRETSNQ